jgi:hypothetical protein
MRRTLWIGSILGAGTLLLLPGRSSAEASSGPGWDHHHMRSNAANTWTPLDARPILIGTPSTATTIGVAEQTLHISPHAWQPGAGVGAGDPTHRAGFTNTSFANPLGSFTHRNSDPGGGSSSMRSGVHRTLR